MSDVTWRKSTFSGDNECVEVGFAWRTSSFSGSKNECVEVAYAPGHVAVRDSKHSQGGVLVFTPAEWQAFISGAKAGEFDLS